jgi:hypothetical protein
MKRAVSVVLWLAVLAMAALADDVSGKWSGTFTPDSGDASAAFLILKQAGGTLTGTAGPDENQQWPISSGKVEGKQVSGVVTNPDGVTYKFVLTADADNLKGSVEVAAGAQTMKGSLDVKRVKP